MGKQMQFLIRNIKSQFPSYSGLFILEGAGEEGKFVCVLYTEAQWKHLYTVDYRISSVLSYFPYDSCENKEAVSCEFLQEKV